MPCRGPEGPPQEIRSDQARRHHLRRSLTASEIERRPMNELSRHVRTLATEPYDTRTLLKNAVEQAIERRYEDFFMVDVDSHHYETESFAEIVNYIRNPVIREEAKFQGMSRGGITSDNGSYQELM